MKKTIRTYSRRMLSVMMAALMLLTAWVFVAPETAVPQAEAVNAVNTGFTASIRSHNCSGSHITIESVSASVSNISSTGFTVNVSVRAYADKGDASTWGTTRSWSGTINVNVNGVNAGSINGSGSAEMFQLGDSTKRCDWDGSFGVTRSINSIYIDGTSSVDIPASGSSTATFTAYPLDQFGVKKDGNISFSNNGGFSGSTSSGSSQDTYTMTLPASKRTAAASKSYTITASCGGKSATKTLTTYSKYRFTYTGNGGTLGSPSYYDARYGSTVGNNFPTTGTRIGYEFIGMSTAGTSNYDATKPSTFSGKLTSSQTMTADTTYKGTWWAKDVKVTYLNNDGSVVVQNGITYKDRQGKYDKSANYLSTSQAPDRTQMNYVYPPGVNNQGTYTYHFARWEVVSAKQYTTANSNAQTDYSALVGTEYGDDVLKGDTVFQAIYEIDGNTPHNYTVNYYNGSATPWKSDSLHYRDSATNYTATKASDNTYSYTFKGWATRLLANDTQYIYDPEDGTFDDGNSHSLITDFTVYHDMNLVAVYEKAYIPYTVNFVYTDRTENPDGTYSYTLAQSHPQTYRYGDAIVAPNDVYDYVGTVEGQAGNLPGKTYRFIGWDNDPATNVSANVTYTAQYEEVDVPFTVQFVDEDGTVINENNTSFSYGTDISAVATAAYNALAGKTYRDDDYEYTFDGWDKEVQVVKDNAVYTAVYSRSALYPVTFINEGNEVTTWKGVEGESIPALPNDIAEPEKPDDDYAEHYDFAGWAEVPYDAANPAAVSSNLTVEARAMTLYAQYECTPINYVVNFKYYDRADGAIKDHEATYTYGQPIAEPADEDLFIFEEVDGEMVNTGVSYQDETFYYAFGTWDKPVQATVSTSIPFVTDEETGNRVVTYTANYRQSYVYYKVTWLFENGEKVNGKNYKEESYVFNERIRVPYGNPPTSQVSSDPNFTYIFDQWVLAEENNGTWTAVADGAFVPGTRIEAGKTYAYLPTFKLAANVIPLTIIVGEETETKQLTYGTTIRDPELLPDPAPASSNADGHFGFVKWVYVGGDHDGEEVGAADTLTAATTIKAIFEQKAHTYKLFDVTEAPTFTTDGEAIFECEICHYIPMTDGETPQPVPVNLGKLADDVNPQTRLYVKDDHWNSADGLTDIAEPAKPVALNSMVIINGADTADVTKVYVNKYDLSVLTEAGYAAAANQADYIELTFDSGVAEGSRVQQIYFATAEYGSTPLENQLETLTWQQVYSYDADNPTEANISGVVADAGFTEDDNDKKFVVYVKVVDGMGNVAYINSELLQLDTVAPVVTLDGEGNVEARKFCEAVTITADDFETAVLDGNAVTLPLTLDATEDAALKGKHQIKVTDTAGNVTMVAFEIVGSHKTVTVYTAATCTAPGSTSEVCQLCGQTIGTPTPTDPLGHDYQKQEVAATCTEPGSVKWVCSRCGAEDPDRPEENPPALGHSWNAGKIGKKANCTENGVITFKCTRCKIEETISGDVLDQTLATYDADVAAEVLEAHPGLAVLDADNNPVQATDAFGNPAYVQKTDSEDHPLFTDEPAVDAEGNTIYVNEGGVLTPAMLPDYDTDKPIYRYTIVHDYTNHNFKSPKQTTAPTCTEDGEITKTCRYCNLAFHVETVPARGHSWTADPEDATKWTILVQPTCTTDGSRYPTKCAVCGADNEVNPETGEYYGQEVIEKLGHDIHLTETYRADEPYVNENGDLVIGYDKYTCEREGCDYEEITWVLADVSYTFTFVSEGAQVGETLSKRPGEIITKAEVPTVTKAEDNEFTYAFEAWMDGENAVSFPLTVTNDMGDKTFTAKFKATQKTYTIHFYGEDGTTWLYDRGYKTYNQEFVEIGPAKEQDDTYTYTFLGWIPLDAGDDATPITTIKVTGEASYKAVYEKALRKYTVAWTIDGVVKETNTEVLAGTTLKSLYDAYGADSPIKAPAKDYDDTYHYAFTGWSLDPTDETVVITADTRVVAQFSRTKHHNVLFKDTLATCTEPAKKVYKCDVCGYQYEVTSGKALGHDFANGTQLAYQAPTPEADGYKRVQCARCDEIEEIVLKFYAIKLTINVKDTAHNPVKGAKVSVYDGSMLIDTDITNSDGVATVWVPEAKQYTIVIEGAEFPTVSGTITVNQNGRIIDGSIPTPKAATRCTCTCHKSGIWPQVFRFFHRIIRILTGKYHCCADANY